MLSKCRRRIRSCAHALPIPRGNPRKANEAYQPTCELAGMPRPQRHPWSVRLHRTPTRHWQGFGQGCPVPDNAWSPYRTRVVHSCKWVHRPRTSRNCIRPPPAVTLLIVVSFGGCCGVDNHRLLEKIEAGSQTITSKTVGVRDDSGFRSPDSKKRFEHVLDLVNVKRLTDVSAGAEPQRFVDLRFPAIGSDDDERDMF
jgi:hypothetical protein